MHSSNHDCHHLTEIVPGAEHDHHGILSLHGLPHGGGVQHIALHHRDASGGAGAEASGVTDQHSHIQTWGRGGDSSDEEW